MGRGAGGGRPKNKYDHRTIGCPLARRCSGWGCAWRGQADWRRACNQCGRRGDPREPIVSVLCHDPDLGINVLVADTEIFAFREEHADTARGLAARLSRRWNARPPPEAIALTGQREAVAEEGRRARRRSRLRKGPPSNRAMMLIMTTVTKRMMVVDFGFVVFGIFGLLPVEHANLKTSVHGPGFSFASKGFNHESLSLRQRGLWI